MSNYPDNDGKEAIEMADLSTSSPVGGLHFHYDFNEQGEAVELDGRNDSKDDHSDSGSGIRVIWQSPKGHLSTPPVVQKPNNEASIPKPPQRSFKPPTRSQYDEGHYTIANEEGLESSQWLTSVQQTKRESVLVYIFIGAIVTVLIGGTITMALLLKPGNGLKAANDTSKSF